MKTTNDQVVKLHIDWRTAQVYHAAIRSANRLMKRKRISKKRIIKVLLQEFEGLMK